METAGARVVMDQGKANGTDPSSRDFTRRYSLDYYMETNMPNKKFLWMIFGLSCLMTLGFVRMGSNYDNVVTLIHTPVRKLMSSFSPDVLAEPLPRFYTLPIPRTMSIEDSSNASNQKLTKPVHHIAFIKVHKAASTTVQNIFLRYGYDNDLVFALPRTGSTISVRQTISPNNILPPPPNRGYDISCSHVRYNREAFEQLLPNDTKYFGIVREPFRHFQSNLQYYRQGYIVRIPGERPVLEYLLHNDKYMKFGGQIPSTYNRMAFDFGFPDELFWSNNRTEIDKYISKLDNEMDLVIVTEYFDESIVMMRRILNWDLKFVLYGKLNSKQKKDPRLIIGSEEESLYRNWALIDYALYNYFLAKIKQKIKQQPPDFFDELAYFRKTKTKFNSFCISALSDGPSDMAFEGSQWNKPFVITRDQCKHVYIREIPFYGELREERLFQIYKETNNLSDVT
ncbi:galactose-3-O-sulfotransferase 3-like [Argopecten irradians]|uniref:galactose-3-O-sulfotransferase 3-like n=1 Tax=Argopecten irradians TaxID=31199 RepID=UPI00371A47F4